ncbi:hypothetical protein GTY65_16405 [Streptomyces sp. SID8379]|uniref:tautomerase family protein n=1 Tax=unclassified Streptomyces TaxID=2593676 RepID=UPI0003700985|nr:MULTISPECIES: hypothetical protein [unclassified Streptomyces]MYW65627.1 hypothetical protein [Streptomyces sp. SID8379]
MPHFTVHITESALTDTTEKALISELTDAVGSVFGDGFRDLVAVDLVGIPAHRRAIGGTTITRAAPTVTLSLREGAYRHPQVPDAAARLVVAITDAVAGALGEQVREEVTVSLEAVPAGRSGAGGQVG